MSEVDERLLNDYVDGELSPQERQRLEDRLPEDPGLRAQLEALAGTVDALRSLPTEARVPESVWRGTLGRIAEDSGTVGGDGYGGSDHAHDDRRVVPLARPSRRSAGSGPSWPGVGLRWSQLAAAAAILVGLTGAVTWSLASRGSARLSPGPTARAAVTQSRFASDVAFEEYEASADALRQIIELGSASLAPETLDVVRSSLAAIDLAIAEARSALEDDPGSEALSRMLTRNMKKKLDLLRNTAAAIRAAA